MPKISVFGNFLKSYEVVFNILCPKRNLLPFVHHYKFAFPSKCRLSSNSLKLPVCIDIQQWSCLLLSTHWVNVLLAISYRFFFHLCLHPLLVLIFDNFLVQHFNWLFWLVNRDKGNIPIPNKCLIIFDSINSSTPFNDILKSTFLSIELLGRK